MLNCGKKFRALRNNKKIHSNSCVVRKKFLNETKNHEPPPPLQVKWSVPNHMGGVIGALAVVSLISDGVKSKTTKFVFAKPSQH